MKIARDFSLAWQRLFWLLPLLPLIIVTDLTALLWLGSTALVLMFVRASRKPTFDMVYRNIWISVAIGFALGSAIHFLLDPFLVPWAERITDSKLDLSQFAKVHGDAGEYMSLLILALLFGGIVEEVTFRGFFIGWGSQLFGVRWAIPLVILTGIVFGYGHWYQAPTGAVVTGVSGLLFGLLYVLCQRKLLPVIACHMTANFWGVTDIYLNGV